MNEFELKPDLTGRGGRIATTEVAKALVNKINTGARFANSKHLTSAEEDVAAASAQLDRMLLAMHTSIAAFVECEKQIERHAKVASSNLKQAAEQVGQGIARIEKAANFDKLERYVALLERAASAMLTLSELEKSGKLEKITNAIR